MHPDAQFALAWLALHATIEHLGEPSHGGRTRWKCAGSAMLDAGDFAAIDVLKRWAAEAKAALEER